MTVSYQFEVATSHFATFLGLLARWRGSMYKLLFKEFLIFAVSYYVLAFISKWGLTAEQGTEQDINNATNIPPDGTNERRELMESVSNHASDYINSIPMPWILGFYVNMVVIRWWQVFNTLPWVDRFAFMVNTFVEGADQKGRMYRRTIIRWMNLSAVMGLRTVSTAVRKRFPTMEHLVEADLMTPDEKQTIDKINPKWGDYYQPIFWVGTLAMKARNEGYIGDEARLQQILSEATNFRSCIANLLCYDWIPVPLVYTQVVSLAVYAYCAGLLIGNQYVEARDRAYEYARFFPVFTFLQFIFYLGWLKTAEVMISPLGEDDDDFELNWLVDRNVGAGFVMVDDLNGVHPPLDRDPFWDDPDPTIPYTESSKGTCVDTYQGTASRVEVKQAEQEWAAEDHAELVRKNTHYNLLGYVRPITDHEKSDMDEKDGLNPTENPRRKMTLGVLGQRILYPLRRTSSGGVLATPDVDSTPPPPLRMNGNGKKIRFDI